MPTVWIESTESTNSYLKSLLSEGAVPRPPIGEAVTLYAAREQTAGRGQRGNTWESEPDKNLTFSFCLNPGLRPAGQFAISEAVALAIVRTLAEYGIEAKVKWPNDIYVGDRKICGILIENSIMGNNIAESVVGVGLNINQREFISDAPNPVSMKQLTGKEYGLQEIADTLTRNFDRYLALLWSGSKGKGLPSAAENISEDALEELHEDYMEALLRNDGNPYPYRDAHTEEEFFAVIQGVEPTGHILLNADGTIRRFAFKEVVFLKP